MKRHNQFTVNLLLLTLALVMSCQFVSADVNDSIYNVTFSTTSCGSPVVRQFSHGNVLTIYADNDSAHIFTGWSDGITANPRVITVTSDTSFIAQYAAAGSGFGTLHTATVSFNGCSTSSVQQYSSIANVTITAEPEPHYHFVNWSDGNTDNPRMIHITSDTNLVANVAIDQYTVTLNGSHVTTTGAGTYGWGSQVTITAVPDANYHFVCWSDSNTNATRTFTAEENVTLTALVEGDPFTLTTLGSNGSVVGGGTYPYNSVVTLTAIPNEHYHFLYWSDGDTSRVRTVTVTGNKSYVAVFVIDQYRVTLPAENGTVTGAGMYNYGSEVQITATANPHYHFVQWSDGVTTTSRTIVLTQDTILTAIFEGDAHNVVASTTNGSVIGTGTFPYGTQVSVIVVPDTHYRFISWSDGNTDNPRSFVLTQDTVLTAITDVTQHNVTVIVENATIAGDGVYGYNSVAQVTVIPNEHYAFMQWSDGVTTATRNVTVTSDTTLYAIVIPQTHNVTASSINGMVTGGGLYGYNTQVTIQAIPDVHYHFMHWNDGNTSNPRTFTITQDTSFVAVMGIDSFRITSYVQHGTTLGTGTYPYNQTVSLTAVPDEHYHFTQWSDGNMSNPRSVVVTKDTSFTPIMAADIHNVSVTAVNGSVTGAGSFGYNTQVTLYATPNDHYHFLSWNDGNTSNPRTFTITQDTSFVAVMGIDSFQITSYAQNGTTLGTGIYPYNQSAQLTAVPDEHYHFAQWSDGNTDNPRVVVVTKDTSFTPIMAIDMHNVSVTVTNGSVSGAGSFGYNTQVTLYATPNAHYHFVSWSDGNTANPRTFTLTRDTSFSAVIEIDRHTVTTSGEHATVTGGGEYDYGTSITLAATVDDHCTFVSWSDGCTDNPRQMVVTSDTILAVIVTVDQVQLTVSAYNGSVSGSGSYNYGSNVTLTVIPAQGYMFEKWNDGNTDNPRVVTLTSETLLIATCKKYYEVKVSTSDKYTVTGAGTYFEGDIATLEVTSLDDDLVFDHWSDYNTDNPRTVVVNSNISLGVTMKQKKTPVDNIAEEIVNFVMAPNPVGKSEYVEINVYGHVEEECTVTIQDAAGGIMDVFRTDAFPLGFTAPSVDGTYFVRIVSCKHDVTLKLIVK